MHVARFSSNVRLTACRKFHAAPYAIALRDGRCDMGLCYETGQKLPVAPQGTGCEVRAGLEADLSLMPSL